MKLLTLSLLITSTFIIVSTYKSCHCLALSVPTLTATTHQLIEITGNHKKVLISTTINTIRYLVSNLDCTSND